MIWFIVYIIIAFIVMGIFSRIPPDDTEGVIWCGILRPLVLLLLIGAVIGEMFK